MWRVSSTVEVKCGRMRVKISVEQVEDECAQKLRVAGPGTGRKRRMGILKSVYQSACPYVQIRRWDRNGLERIPVEMVGCFFLFGIGDGGWWW